MTEKRKTLADIRREINAEFPPLEDETGADNDETLLDEKTLEALRVPPRRRQGRRSYVMIALLATLAVELFVLGYLAGRLYRDERVGAVPSTVMAGPAAPMPPAASVTSAPAPPIVTPEVSSRVVAVEPGPSPDHSLSSRAAADSAGRISAPERDATPGIPAHAPPSTVAAVRDPMAPDPGRVTPDARRVIPDANRVTTEANRVRPEASPVVPQPSRVPADAKLVTLALPGPGDWVESQSQLRAALREWLKLSGYAGPSSEADDAEVVLGADGRTAKTRVAVRVAGQIIIREQRWRRDARGWSIVEESQVQSPRPR